MDQKFKTGHGQPTATASADFYARSDMSLTLLEPLTEAAREWVAEHLPEDAQTFGTSIVVENRYMSDIVTGIRRDGLVIR